MPLWPDATQWNITRCWQRGWPTAGEFVERSNCSEPFFLVTRFGRASISGTRGVWDAEPYGTWERVGLDGGVMSAVAISLWLQHATLADPRERATGGLSRDTVSTADRPKELQQFIPVDTSRLMGSPYPIPQMKVEVAFLRLKIARPVQPTHVGDDSNGMFVVTQCGLVYVFPNRADVSKADVFLDLRKVVSPGNGD